MGFDFLQLWFSWGLFLKELFDRNDNLFIFDVGHDCGEVQS